MLPVTQGDGKLGPPRSVRDLVARDLTAPSAFAAEAINAAPYAFLDDAPLEERRTQAVQARRFGDGAAVRDLGLLDAEAIAGVREDAWPNCPTPSVVAMRRWA